MSMEGPEVLQVFDWGRAGWGPSKVGQTRRNQQESRDTYLLCKRLKGIYGKRNGALAIHNFLAGGHGTGTLGNLSNHTKYMSTGRYLLTL